MINTLNRLRTDLKKPYEIPDFLSKSKFPSLDGWRALAIIVVIFGHAKYTIDSSSLYFQFADIFVYSVLGVRLFFALSGFLITTLLLKEYIRNGRINIKNFFIKRALRIFPVLYLYLLVILLLNSIFNLGLRAKDFIPALLYVNNFHSLNSAWLTGHTWTLSIEEQFYLIWPFVFNAIPKKAWWFCIFMIAPIPLLKVFWYYNRAYLDVTFEPFLAYADGIFMGALFAMLSFKGFFNPRQLIFKTQFVIVSVLVIFFISFFLQRGKFAFVLLPFGGTITNLLLCIILLQTLLIEHTFLYKLLNHPWVIKIGMLSYSLYIWQQAFLVPREAYNGFFFWAFFPLNIVFAFIAAYISYHYYEVYFLRLKTRLIPTQSAANVYSY